MINGATFDELCISKNASPLYMASGGVKCLDDVKNMVAAEASRIGASYFSEIVKGEKINSKY